MKHKPEAGYRVKRSNLPKGKGIAIAAGAYIAGGGPPIDTSTIVRLDGEGSRPRPGAWRSGRERQAGRCAESFISHIQGAYGD